MQIQPELKTAQALQTLRHPGHLHDRWALCSPRKNLITHSFLEPVLSDEDERRSLGRGTLQ
jgi:hypothetical protein